MPPKQRKIAVMGYRSVGKSSLTIQYVETRFVDSYEPTIENTFTKNTKVNGQEYFIKLVDTAGQRKNFWLPGGRPTVSRYGPEGKSHNITVIQNPNDESFKLDRARHSGHQPNDILVLNVVILSYNKCF
ncbi:GTP-binding protein Rheb [Trichonephila clavipes]|nr:GTP-binding protein Rheb [Trichonephila clavipes]